MKPIGCHRQRDARPAAPAGPWTGRSDSPWQLRARRRRIAGWLVLAPLLSSLSGCCTLARLFCGPDRTPWVPIAHDTPRATLATLLEAIRRDDPDRVYDCLAPGFLTANNLDRVTMNAAWTRVRQEVTGLHLLGYAAIPDTPVAVQDGGVSYVVEAEGHPIRIDLIRQSYQEIRYRDGAGQTQRPGAVFDGDTFNGHLQIRDAGRDPIDDVPQSRLELHSVLIPHPGVETLRIDDVDAVILSREWKVANITLPG